MRLLPALSLLVACQATPANHPPASPSGDSSGTVPARAPIVLTYLGVAGWQLDAGGRTLLADPYFSRPPDESLALVPDPVAIRAHSPERADLVFIGHSHFDHLLDAPTVAMQTGATLMGSATTAHVARSSGVPGSRIITVKGGEDFEMDGYSIRVVPSLHSALGDKHVFGGVLDEDPQLPMAASGYQEGGSYAYLVRIAGHEILFLDTANFIEKEVEGLRPDIAIVAIGLRQHVHDYTCRLLRALGGPARVYANHFDDFRGPPVDQPPDDDLTAFVRDASQCSPRSAVAVPKHFEPMHLR